MDPKPPPPPNAKVAPRSSVGAPMQSVWSSRVSSSSGALAGGGKSSLKKLRLTNRKSGCWAPPGRLFAGRVKFLGILSRSSCRPKMKGRWPSGGTPLPVELSSDEVDTAVVVVRNSGAVRNGRASPRAAQAFARCSASLMSCSFSRAGPSGRGTAPGPPAASPSLAIMRRGSCSGLAGSSSSAFRLRPLSAKTCRAKLSCGTSLVSSAED
mmetsp:Transcript_74185/g.191391  ORF Transcript_74185/g.191391 Transcript_74185/m.191391 type:complete len:210 (-) Transcript_74185:534-1163(-)